MALPALRGVTCRSTPLTTAVRTMSTRWLGVVCVCVGVPEALRSSCSDWTATETVVEWQAS
ncbi:hypothetical protein PF005_g10797 [Phytophthora fragariae]|uniref:Uncharacterized protein n=1 Tax=Phytophthora fragariae TaxID=53985 RepID=A0A6A3ZCE2_9STRA|nr:hypothetical protein PF003_g11401 [Phytophthora fragariae]KAE8938159.1 hypothetical protein PF009_g11953 [Phytophthora fragariae]KAE9119089.1 hypothetical protein PF007_g8693 [Phytophthora fragariae]KAE9145013.1 hypothetical protein PF006_g10098 [Phytophthora fragariae]KAE9211994.1 hypothetical protein PF005_g10797 [Phytophthora fragariae]